MGSNEDGPTWRRSSRHLLLQLPLLRVLLLQLVLLIMTRHAVSAQSQTQTQQPQTAQDAVSFRPSIAIVIGIFSIMFSLTFLLLMYAKFCHSAGATGLYGAPPQGFLYDIESAGAADDTTTGSRFSGVDKTVIESLPFFRFSSLRGVREGLECAVCLSRFEGAEVLRLLPRCKHAFHIGCVDRWLEAHSSCPLCRCRVRIEDVTLFKYSTSSRFLFRHSNGGNTDEDLEMQLELYVEREPHEEEDGGADGDPHRKPAGCAPSSSLRFGGIGESFRKHLDAFKSGVAGGGGPRKAKTTAATHKGDRPPLLANMARVEAPHPPVQPMQQQIMHKFRHRIIVSDVVFKNRWSDLNSADITSLNSDMLSAVSSGRFNPLPLRALTEQDKGAKGPDKDFTGNISATTGGRAVAAAVLTIKEEMERKRTLESKAGEMISSSAATGTIAGSSSRPLDPNTDAITGTATTTIDHSSPLIITEKQRCMSEITDVPRIDPTLLATSGGRYGSTYAPRATAATSKEEKVRRVWIPIARRTVQWLAGRERRSSLQQHVPPAPCG